MCLSSVTSLYLVQAVTVLQTSSALLRSARKVSVLVSLRTRIALPMKIAEWVVIAV